MYHTFENLFVVWFHYNEIFGDLAGTGETIVNKKWFKACFCRKISRWLKLLIVHILQLNIASLVNPAKQA